MSNAIRKAAWLSLFTNVLIFILMISGFAADGPLSELLRVATAPGWAATFFTEGQIVGIALMVTANWIVWLTVWLLAISAVREFRGAPAW